VGSEILPGQFRKFWPVEFLAPERREPGRRRASFTTPSSATRRRGDAYDDRPLTRYFDGWVPDGRSFYTGEGQRGDQALIQGNFAVLRHREEDRALRLFRGARPEAGDRVSLEELAEPFSRHVSEHLKIADKQGTSPQSRFLDTCRKFKRGVITKDELIAAFASPPRSRTRSARYLRSARPSAERPSIASRPRS
jgi:hypothetical protein